MLFYRHWDILIYIRYNMPLFLFPYYILMGKLLQSFLGKGKIPLLKNHHDTLLLSHIQLHQKSRVFL